MNTQQLKAEIENLPLPEKLALVADIWDSIAASKQTIPLPEWQIAELDNRYDEYTKGEQSLHDWQSVHEAVIHSVFPSRFNPEKLP